MRNTLLFAAVLFFGACQNNASPEEAQDQTPAKLTELTTGSWRGAIMLNDSTEMPFNFELEKDNDSSYSFTIKNAEECIEATAKRRGDSLKVTMPVFANYIKVQVNGDQMEGTYVNPDAKNYKLPFSARAGVQNRFSIDSMNCCDINKKWRVEIAAESDGPTAATAFFEQESTSVTGTSMTETGVMKILN